MDKDLDLCRQIDGKPEWHSGVNDALGDVITACRRTNQKGELSIKIKIIPSLDKTGQTIVTMGMEVSAKIPRPSPGMQTAYVITDDDDRAVGLSREHPDQMEMFAKFSKEQETK